MTGSNKEHLFIKVSESLVFSKNESVSLSTNMLSAIFA